ncbi:MAG: protein BatD [Planctomycetaceae bacterium]|nr:protein BatD [Planctomycetaceae bacterium]
MSARSEKGVRNHLPGTGPPGAMHKWFLTPFSLLSVVGLFLLMPGAACAEISVHLASETASLFVYEPFTLRLDVQCDAPPDTPELPVVPGLTVTTVRRLPSDPARRKHAFQIEMIAERDGILTVPPFAVRVKGEAAFTSALRLPVSRPRPASEMSLAVAVEPTMLRVGQPATVTVTWNSAVSFTRCKQLRFEIPLLADERCRVFPLDPPVPESEGIGLPVNNIRMVAQADALPDGRQSLSFRYQLVPREPCVLRAPPAQLLCALFQEDKPAAQSQGHFYNHFFEAAEESEAFEEVYLAAAVPEITVRDLAETGRTARFAEIVGPCALRTSVAPTRMVVGQPALFTVHLEDLTFARQITALPSAAFDGLRCEFQLSREPIREDGTDNTRSFTYVLRPLHAGIKRIPAVVMQTFDPGSNSYQTLRSESTSITVDVDQEDGSPTFTPRVDSEPPIPLHGVRHNRLDERTMIPLQHILEFLGRLWWVFVPLAPLLWLVLLPLVRRRERCRRDPVYARAVAAWRRFRRTVRRDEESAWRVYLADRLALCAEALTADTVTEALRARNVDAGLIAEARRRFEEKDAAEYGKRPAAPSHGTQNLVRRLQKATAPLLLLVWVLFVPSPAGAADRADELFVQAMQMREEKPDEAQPLFIDAALRFESAERFLNAGNSWFFAGENGRALANYLAAQRRSPFDRQLRDSIEFLRANRADAFPSPAAPPGKLAVAWNRYGTWMPRLRVGSFVLAYLLAWAVFLTAQLTGRRVRRAVWVVLIAAIIVPLASLAQTSLRHAEGVVIEDAVARLGPGYAYDPAFEQPLHKATEFTWMESRQGWTRLRLPDDSEAWLRESECMQVE